MGLYFSLYAHMTFPKVKEKLGKERAKTRREHQMRQLSSSLRLHYTFLSIDATFLVGKDGFTFCKLNFLIWTLELNYLDFCIRFDMKSILSQSISAYGQEKKDVKTPTLKTSKIYRSKIT